MKNADLPAMPIGQQMDVCHLNAPCNGSTKREHFAGLFMSSMLVNAGRNGFEFDDTESISIAAFKAADDFFKAGELERTK